MIDLNFKVLNWKISGSCVYYLKIILSMIKLWDYFNSNEINMIYYHMIIHLNLNYKIQFYKLNIARIQS